MKDQALAIIQDVSSPSDKLNLLREYLQAMALRSLHESEAFVSLAFVGGTALRFVYGLPRFSEDIDFSLADSSDYKPEAWMKKLKRDLQLAGFNAAVKWNDRRTVHKAWIKVAGLLKEAGLAAMADQNLSIKLEIDTNPPKGAVSETGIVNRHAMLSLRYYNLPSLMAGKIHALITRKYAKGRDWYDLLWYRARRPPVAANLEQLQNALDQTHDRGVFNAENWESDVVERLKTIDCAVLVNDVKNFLERPEDAALLTEDNIRSVLK
ncbi:MAG: nucleotidyl transferase AbiEii/AbiGii toxin family protein [Phycisphaerae bacterium]|nr:nucleotidyl transferase AbiEii/AbiGii toxin family protein [Phycisphaerae bacterium]